MTETAGQGPLGHARSSVFLPSASACAVLAIAMLVSANWPGLAPVWRFAILGALLLGSFFMSGWAEHAQRPGARDVFLVTGAALVPISLFQIAQTWQMPLGLPTQLLIATLVALALSIWFRSRWVLVFASVLSLVWLSYGTYSEYLRPGGLDWYTALILVAGLGLAWWHRSAIAFHIFLVTLLVWIAYLLVDYTGLGESFESWACAFALMAGAVSVVAIAQSPTVWGMRILSGWTAFAGLAAAFAVASQWYTQSSYPDPDLMPARVAIALGFVAFAVAVLAAVPARAMGSLKGFGLMVCGLVLAISTVVPFLLRSVFGEAEALPVAGIDVTPRGVGEVFGLLVHISAFAVAVALVHAGQRRAHPLLSVIGGLAFVAYAVLLLWDDGVGQLAKALVFAVLAAVFLGYAYTTRPSARAKAVSAP